MHCIGPSRFCSACPEALIFFQKNLFGYLLEQNKMKDGKRNLNLHSLAYIIGITYSDVSKADPVHDSCAASIVLNCINPDCNFLCVLQYSMWYSTSIGSQ